MMVLLLMPLAAAQSVASSTVAKVNADPFRPALDPGSLLVTESTMVPEQIIARADLVWVHNPFTWENKTDRSTIIGDAFGLHLSGGLGLGRASLGATALLLQLERSDLYDDDMPARMAGDLSLSGKFPVIEGDGLRLAALGGFTAPLGATKYYLGHAKPSGDFGLAAGTGATFRGLLNLGYRVRPETTLDEKDAPLVLGNAFQFRGGGAWAPTSQLTVTGELSAQFYHAGWSITNSPAEIILGASRQNDAGRILRGGFGMGIINGIGAPTWRLMLGVGHHPSAAQIEPSQLPTAPDAPAETPPAETPPAETPPAETPPAETPPAETPPAEDAPEDTPTEDTPTEDAPSPG